MGHMEPCIHELGVALWRKLTEADLLPPEALGEPPNCVVLTRYKKCRNDKIAPHTDSLPSGVKYPVEQLCSQAKSAPSAIVTPAEACSPTLPAKTNSLRNASHPSFTFAGARVRQ